MEHTIRLENGRLPFVDDDALGDLLDEGTAAVCRASHVEPHPSRTRWIAARRPSGGSMLGKDGTTHWVLADQNVPYEYLGPLERPIISQLLEPFPTRAAERASVLEHKGR